VLLEVDWENTWWINICQRSCQASNGHYPVTGTGIKSEFSFRTTCPRFKI